MALSMKERYARLDISKLPKNYADEFEEMSKQTYGFSDEDLNDIFSENFSDMYSLVEKKYPDAIKRGGEIKSVKPAKIKVLTSKKDKLPKVKGAHVKSRKLSPKDVVDIEGAIVEANQDDVVDEELISQLENDFGISHAQAIKWVLQRKKYKPGTAYGDYHERTEKKKEERKKGGKNIVKTRDGYEFDKRSPENKGLKFFDENGKEWTCKGYNVKLDECIMEDKEGKQISSCLRDMYVYNPVEDREKGTMVRDCKETLKKAGYTVKEHAAGTKKIKRSEPRPERDIIKERVESTFKPILKDISGSEEKEKKYKETISILKNVEILFTKLFNRLNNLAEDNNTVDIKKIEELLKDLIG